MKLLTSSSLQPTIFGHVTFPPVYRKIFVSVSSFTPAPTDCRLTFFPVPITSTETPALLASSFAFSTLLPVKAGTVTFSLTFAEESESEIKRFIIGLKIEERIVSAGLDIFCGCFMVK